MMLTMNLWDPSTSLVVVPSNLVTHVVSQCYDYGLLYRGLVCYRCVDFSIGSQHARVCVGNVLSFSRTYLLIFYSLVLLVQKIATKVIYIIGYRDVSTDKSTVHQPYAVTTEEESGR